jgi:hypothetical protein
MPPTPSPSAARLAAAALGPLVILVTALIAAYINWRVLKQRTAADKTSLEQKRQADASALEQKTTADNRAEWWRRVQWPLDGALDEDESTKAPGLATLDRPGRGGRAMSTSAAQRSAEEDCSCQSGLHRGQEEDDSRRAPRASCRGQAARHPR